MAENAGTETLVAVVGIDHGEHRAEPGDVVDWLPEKVAKRLLREGALEKAEKPAPEATGSAETAEPAEKAPEGTESAPETQTSTEGDADELPAR